jgi:hypothetical protein
VYEPILLPYSSLLLSFPYKTRASDGGKPFFANNNFLVFADCGIINSEKSERLSIPGAGGAKGLRSGQGRALEA